MCWKCQCFDEPPPITCQDHWDLQAERMGDTSARSRRITRAMAALAACERAKLNEVTAAAAANSLSGERPIGSRIG